jgi:hypothetical protein
MIKRVPVLRDDEAKIIDFVTPIWREALEMHAARYNRDNLIADLEAYIRRGYDEQQWAISKAEAGDEFGSSQVPGHTVLCRRARVSDQLATVV